VNIRPVALSTGFCIALGMASQPAAAQFDGWAVLTTAEEPAVIAMALHCPVFDEANEQAFCLTIGCTPDDPFSFGFSFLGYDRPNDWTYSATYTIDGRSFDPVQMRLVGLGNFDNIIAAYDDDTHADLLDAIRRGLQMEVRFDGDVLPPQGFPLGGSLLSIDRARALCEASDDIPATSLVGQRVDVWEMLRGDPDDTLFMDFIPDGTLRMTLNGQESVSRWSIGADDRMCLDWPEQSAPVCGIPEIVRGEMSLRLETPDGTLAARLTGALMGPAS